MYIVESISKYENGNMHLGEVVELFQGLVNTGLAWTLQDHYQKTARLLIHQGFVSPSYQTSGQHKHMYTLEP